MLHCQEDKPTTHTHTHTHTLHYKLVKLSLFKNDIIIFRKYTLVIFSYYKVQILIDNQNFLVNKFVVALVTFSYIIMFSHLFHGLKKIEIKYTTNNKFLRLMPRY